MDWAFSGNLNLWLSTISTKPFILSGKGQRNSGQRGFIILFRTIHQLFSTVHTAMPQSVGLACRNARNALICITEMSLKLPKYNGKDNLVMLVIMPVFAIAINSLVFGSTVFQRVLKSLLRPLLLAAVAGCIEFMVCGQSSGYPEKPFSVAETACLNGLRS